MNKIIGGAGLCLLALLPLVGCGPKWDGEGVVVEKVYDDPDWTTRYRRVCGQEYGYDIMSDSWGWQQKCHSVPYDYLEPERFLLTIRWEHTDDKGKTTTHHNEVSIHESVWNTCKVGQHYSRSTNECRSR